MRKQAHWLAAGSARGKLGIDRLGQAFRFVFDRTPPVVGEGNDFVRVGKSLDEVVGPQPAAAKCAPPGLPGGR